MRFGSRNLPELHSDIFRLREDNPPPYRSLGTERTLLGVRHTLFFGEGRANFLYIELILYWLKLYYVCTQTILLCANIIQTSRVYKFNEYMIPGCPLKIPGILSVSTAYSAQSCPFPNPYTPPELPQRAPPAPRAPLAAPPLA